MKFKVCAPSDRFTWHFLALGEAGKALPVTFSPPMATKQLFSDVCVVICYVSSKAIT